MSLTTGLGQVLFTTVFGYLIGLALGLDALTAIYVAIALTFSSTIIIVKLLSDKREIDSLHGRIALGFLIVQDVVVVLAMIVLSALGVGAAGDAPLAAILQVFGYGLAMLAFVAVFRALCRRSAGGASVAGAGTARVLRHRLGGAAGGGGALPRLRQGTGRAAGRRLAGLHTVPGGHRRAAGEPAGFPAPVLLHRAGRVAGSVDPRRGDLARHRAVALRAESAIRSSCSRSWGPWATASGRGSSPG